LTTSKEEVDSIRRQTTALEGRTKELDEKIKK